MSFYIEVLLTLANILAPGSGPAFPIRIQIRFQIWSHKTGRIDRIFKVNQFVFLVDYLASCTVENHLATSPVESESLCSGSVTFWYGSGSADGYL